MPRRIALISALLLGVVLPNAAVRACGDSEAPVGCGEPSPNALASWMLARVDRALASDQARALNDFNTGANGFRTADTYVFCVGPDGVMSAHPSAVLRGQNVGDLHDRTGNYFIRTMLAEAQPGRISEIRYLFPKPGSTREEPKTTFYTRAGDQTCGVGVYDADVAARAQSTPEARIVLLRERLDAGIPPGLRADWTAFLEALNQVRDARTSKLEEARRGLRAAATALDRDDAPSQGD